MIIKFDSVQELFDAIHDYQQFIRTPQKLNLKKEDHSAVLERILKCVQAGDESTTGQDKAPTSDAQSTDTASPAPIQRFSVVNGPPFLPRIFDVPKGFHHWEYRGTYWNSIKNVVYAYADFKDKQWNLSCQGAASPTLGGACHYIEAVREVEIHKPDEEATFGKCPPLSLVRDLENQIKELTDWKKQALIVMKSLLNTINEKNARNTSLIGSHIRLRALYEEAIRRIP